MTALGLNYVILNVQANALVTDAMAIHQQLAAPLVAAPLADVAV